nr:MAG TPA: hypothetical protein [Caudoviricetes sp.]
MCTRTLLPSWPASLSSLPPPRRCSPRLRRLLQRTCRLESR